MIYAFLHAIVKSILVMLFSFLLSVYGITYALTDNSTTIEEIINVG